MKIHKPLTIFLIAVGGLLLAGCRLPRVEPGNDPLVVRAESLNSTAKSSLRFVLQTDNLDREFFRSSLPGFHAFCSDLRQPIPYQETNTLPRWRVSILTFDDTIVAYKETKSAASSNALVAAQLSLSNLVSLANSWVLVATNLSR